MAGSGFSTTAAWTVGGVAVWALLLPESFARARASLSGSFRDRFAAENGESDDLGGETIGILEGILAAVNRPKFGESETEDALASGAAAADPPPVPPVAPVAPPPVLTGTVTAAERIVIGLMLRMPGPTPLANPSPGFLRIARELELPINSAGGVVIDAATLTSEQIRILQELAAG